MSVLDNIHDGRLKAVVVNEQDRTVRLDCVLVDGRKVWLTLSGVVDLCVNNLRVGNIILFAKVFDSAEHIGAAALAGLAQSRDSARQARYLDVLGMRGTAERRWFVLQSSYGADIACVFDGDLVEDADD